MKRFLVFLFVLTAMIMLTASATFASPPSAMGSGAEQAAITGLVTDNPTVPIALNDPLPDLRKMNFRYTANPQITETTATALTKELGAGQNTQLNHAMYQAEMMTATLYMKALFRTRAIPVAYTVVCSLLNTGADLARLPLTSSC